MTDRLAKLRNVQDRIFTMRGVQVMLDKDIAAFYEVKPIRLREQVKRNKNRFPDDFMFQLTDEEVSMMVSQNAIPSKKHLGGFLPYAFTEQGVAALSAVIKSTKAEEVSVLLMRAFVEMRKFISVNANIFYRLDKVEQKQLYHIGASLKDVGKKWFAFSRMDSMTGDVLQKLKKGR